MVMIKNKKNMIILGGGQKFHCVTPTLKRDKILDGETENNMREEVDSNENEPKEENERKQGKEKMKTRRAEERRQQQEKENQCLHKSPINSQTNIRKIGREKKGSKIRLRKGEPHKRGEKQKGEPQKKGPQNGEPQK
jgi:site-specific DNA-cytosine methylase